MKVSGNVTLDGTPTKQREKNMITIYGIRN